MAALAILKGIQMFTAISPQLLELVLHYKELASGDKLDPVDKEKALKLLEDTAIPDWDNV